MLPPHLKFSVSTLFPSKSSLPIAKDLCMLPPPQDPIHHQVLLVFPFISRHHFLFIPSASAIIPITTFSLDACLQPLFSFILLTTARLIVADLVDWNWGKAKQWDFFSGPLFVVAEASTFISSHPRIVGKGKDRPCKHLILLKFTCLCYAMGHQGW